MKARLTPEAFDDLKRIGGNALHSSESLPARIEQHLFEQLDLFELFPELGFATDEEDVHRWPMTEFRYTIFYRVNWQDERIEVVRIIESPRVRDLRQVPRG